MLNYRCFKTGLMFAVVMAMMAGCFAYEARAFPREIEPGFRHSVAGVTSTISTISKPGATAPVYDTTTVLDASDYDLDKGRVTDGGTAYTWGKLMFVSDSVVANMDSAYAYIDASTDKVNWTQCEVVALLNSSTTGRILQGALKLDWDAPFGTAGSWWGHRYLRIRLQYDSVANWIFSKARAKIVTER